MGGVVSGGADNDELIDNLIEADYIRTAIVERVFRAVDRGHYFTAKCKEKAYRDIAWQYGNLHISAPCIYSKVMENLKLAPGMSFLNIGSGTGYLSTMAGLILGPYGINHGIEIHEDVINYANKKLEEFVSTSSAIDEYEFCLPKFVCGNCLNLGSNARQYDRVYCSAACSRNQQNYIMNLIKVGGILVIPVYDQLLQICRTSDIEWVPKMLLNVSFATLVPGKGPDCQEPLKMPDIGPLSLQDICRFVVRSILRRNIDIEHPELSKLSKVPINRPKKKVLKSVIRTFHCDSEDDDDAFILRSPTNLTEPIPKPPRPGELFEVPDHSCSPEILFQCSSNHLEDDDAMEEDSDHSLELRILSENTLDELSREEVFQGYHEIFFRKYTSSSADVSGGDSESDSDFDSDAEKHKSFQNSLINELKDNVANRLECEKMDSGIVEDVETDDKAMLKNYSAPVKRKQRKGHLYPVHDVDSHNGKIREFTAKVKTEQKNSVSTPNESCLDAVNYSTYMKEKIKMLPLPVTLKYFLNLNRDF